MTSDEQCDRNRKMPGRKSELILSVVAVLYAIIALASHSPKVQNTLMPVYTAWNFLGLQQKWNLFAPIVPAATVHLIGIVTLADGAKVLFVPPHPSNHSLFERILYNRYLKWEADCAPFAPYAPYWPQLCKHILQEFSFPNDKAKSCALIMEMSPIIKPEMKVSPRDVTPERWMQLPLYRQENSEGGTDVGSTH